MSPALLAAPLALMGLLLAVDEAAFHRRRGLGRFEALGHPADTASVALPLLLAAAAPRAPGWLAAYVALAAASCLLVVKDESVHLRECGAGEQRLHALLFMLHPLVLVAAERLWLARSEGSSAAAWILRGQVLATCAFALYQLVAWRKAWLPTSRRA